MYGNNIAVDAVNNHSVENLHEHLAPDFVCAGQSGPIAIQVLAQIITQIDEHISNINKIDERQADATLTLVYDFNYSKRLGHKEATFIFNSDNQIKQMDLLPVQVKKVDMKKILKLHPMMLLQYQWKYLTDLFLLRQN